MNIATRHTPFRATCLSRSLLLGWLLRRRGVASDLRIGVRLTNGVLDAHAWVECSGVPVNDRPDIAAQFALFCDLVPLGSFSYHMSGIAGIIHFDGRPVEPGQVEP